MEMQNKVYTVYLAYMEVLFYHFCNLHEVLQPHYIL